MNHEESTSLIQQNRDHHLSVATTMGATAMGATAMGAHLVKMTLRVSSSVHAMPPSLAPLPHPGGVTMEQGYTAFS